MTKPNRQHPVFTPLQQNPLGEEFPQVILIGERLNTLGSRKFKQLILEEKYDQILGIAEQQIENGAQGLDICVALTERENEAETMQRVLRQITPAVQVPLMIDTTDVPVMEAALQTDTGRFILNSTNLENGNAKADRVFGLAKSFGAAVVALTIDEQGMAKTASRKLGIAERLYDIAVNQHHLHPGDLVIDALTFTLSIGDPAYSTSAQETLDGIRLIKKTFPDILTSLGISNVSFGFPPEIRIVLNNVMLQQAIQNGLDMAIINPAHVKPYTEFGEEEKMLCENLIANQPDALRDIVTWYRKVRAQKKEESKSSQHLEGKKND